MKRPSFLSGAGFALLLAFLGSAVFAALVPFVTAATALRVLISGLGFIYLLWLMQSSRRRTGRVTAMAGWLLLSAVAWLTGAALPFYLLLHVAALWLVRSFACYSGALPALLDLGLNALGISAAAWAITRSGSVFLAVWCFFLVQALFVAIPARVPRRRTGAPPAFDEDDRFERARRRADAAFRHLMARTGR